jgi:hypothetical protein
MLSFCSQEQNGITTTKKRVFFSHQFSPSNALTDLEDREALESIYQFAAIPFEIH